jgi:hypothetical protein
VNAEQKEQIYAAAHSLGLDVSAWCRSELLRAARAVEKQQ